MKRIFSVIVALVLFVSVIPFAGLAVKNDQIGDVIYLPDGYCIVVELHTSPARASGTVTGTKTYTCKDDDGTALWKAVLTGGFSYTGSSSSCTSSSCSVTIYNSNWYTVSKTATKSGNTATASVTMGKKVLGVTVSKVPITINLSCDANGNLS